MVLVVVVGLTYSSMARSFTKDSPEPVPMMDICSLAASGLALLEIQGCYYSSKSPNILAADPLLRTVRTYDYRVRPNGKSLVRLGDGIDALRIQVVDGQWICLFVPRKLSAMA